MSLTLKQLFFSLPTSEDSLYLTFDDGPSAAATPFVLDLLNKYNAKATFFCLGEQVSKHSNLYREIIAQGHAVGNHSYSHPNGWLTNNSTYVDDVRRAATLIDSKLFRPPYGRISPLQFLELRNHYKIVFWTHLVRDYDSKMQPDVEIHRLLKKVRRGAVIVFHDSEQAFKQLKQVLPTFLEHCNRAGIRLDKII